MKYSILLSLLPIWGCVVNMDFPETYKYWEKEGKKVSFEIVWKDMSECGFKNPLNNVSMPERDYLKAYVCMEKKGYLFYNTPTCKRYFEGCKKYHLE